MVRRLVLAIAVAVFVAAGSSTHAGVEPDPKCKDAKFKSAGLKGFALLKAFGKNLKKPNDDRLASDISKAQSKFTKLFTKPEEKGWCGAPTGDVGGVEPEVDECIDDLLSLVIDGTTRCGNGVLGGDEQCDPPDYGGATCESLGFNLGGALRCTAACQYDVRACGCGDTGFPATGQTTCTDSGGSVIPCEDTGRDGDIRAGAPLAYMDNGDGTITDLNTGLMWEKKSDDGSIHDKDKIYTWHDAFAVHAAGLNSANFAGYGDWRVPNVKELQSIVNYGVAQPSISPVFNNTACTPGCTVTTCSCTRSDPHWSSTDALTSTAPNDAWYVGFGGGPVVGDYRYSTHHVRAVRGGLTDSPSGAFLDETTAVLD